MHIHQIIEKPKGLGLEPCYRKIDNFRNIQERIRNLYREQKTTLVVLVDEAQYWGGPSLRI